MKIVEFANSIDPEEVAQIEPHHLYLHCLPWPGRVVQSVGHLTCKSEVLDSIPGLATYFHFSFKRGSCQLLAKVCA